jgi:hypothetical protein
VGAGFGKILSKIGLHPSAKVPNPKSFKKSLLLIFPSELILFFNYFSNLKLGVMYLEV